MKDRSNVLFLCTGSSARSRVAEANALHGLRQRISLMLALRMEALDRLAT